MLYFEDFHSLCRIFTNFGPKWRNCNFFTWHGLFSNTQAIFWLEQFIKIFIAKIFLNSKSHLFTYGVTTVVQKSRHFDDFHPIRTMYEFWSPLKSRKLLHIHDFQRSLKQFVTHQKDQFWTYDVILIKNSVI